MKFNEIMSCFVLTIILNQFFCQIIFEDDFNELNLNKWTVLSVKGNCEGFPLSDNNCNTNNEVNLRTISGKLALTAKYGKYFNSDITTATIMSKEKFKVTQENITTIIKIRASLPIFTGLIPRVILFFSQDQYITILNYNETIWYGYHENSSKTNYSLNGNNFGEFQEFEIRIEPGENHTHIFTWSLNGNQVFLRNYSQNIENVFQTIQTSFKYMTEFKIVITLSVDNILMNLAHFIKDKSCHTFLTDYIRIYQFNGSFIGIDDKSPKNNANETCTKVKLLEDEPFIKFHPANYSKLLLNDDFDETKLDENKWIIKTSSKPSIKEICETQQGYDIGNGKLKLYTISKISKELSFTTRSFFENARMEIRAKPPSLTNCSNKYFLVFKIQPHGSCEINNAELDIALVHYDIQKDHGHYFIFNFLNYGSLKNSGIQVTDKSLNSNDYQVYGIEWSDSYIQWFLNDRVVYQANRDYDSRGQLFRFQNEKICQPFDYPFNMVILFRSFHYRENITQVTQDQMCSCSVDIEYVRIYGPEQSKDDSINKQDNSTNNKILIYSLIAGVIILIIIVMITLVIIVKRQKFERANDDQDINPEHYDDIELNEMESTHNYESVLEYEIIEQNNENTEYIQILN